MAKKVYFRLHFLQSMQTGLQGLLKTWVSHLSEAEVKCCKLIIKDLEHVLYISEEDRIDKLKKEDKITAKKAVSMRAVNKRHYPRR